MRSQQAAAFIEKQARKQAREQSQKQTKQTPASFFWRGAACYGRCLQAVEQDTSGSADFFYRYGCEFLGMAFSTYIHSVIEKIDRFEIDHVMFVARSGYLFQKIYEILTGYMPEAVSPAVTTHYAYLSKTSTLLPAVMRLSAYELARTIAQPDKQGLDSMFKALGLPLSELEALARSHSIDLRSPIQDYWNHPSLLAFLSDRQVQTQVSAYQQQAHARLAQYLSQCGFFGGDRHVALVDIGWDGEIQSNLVRAFNQRPDFPLLHGLYFGLRNQQPEGAPASSFAHGLIYEARNRNINAESVSMFTDIFERCAGAPHAGIIGYELLSAQLAEGVRPVFESDDGLAQQTAAARGAIAVMQQGILDFAHRYGQQWQQQPFNAETNQSFVQGLIARHIAFPTREEAYQIATQLGFVEDPSNHQHKIAVTTRDLWQSIQRGELTAALDQIKRSGWQFGSLRLIRMPGLINFYRARRFLSF